MKMIDTEKLKLLQLIGLGMAAVTVLGLVFWFWLVARKHPQRQKSHQSPNKSKEES